jgi:hypothetical protein
MGLPALSEGLSVEIKQTRNNPLRSATRCRRVDFGQAGLNEGHYDPCCFINLGMK